jgi:hypothetical protein
MILDHQPSWPVRYAVPAARLPELSERFHAKCQGVAPSVPMKQGRGYRMVVCGEIAVRQTIITVNPYTGKWTVDFRMIR